MSRHPFDTFYIPLAIGIAMLLAGLGLPAIGVAISHTIAWLLNVSALLLIAGTCWVAYRVRNNGTGERGGRGGNASATGDGNISIGGKGGDSTGGIGGTGGHATVRGNNSVARGGDGGAG
ncbi:hypothetical protein LMG31841_01164 [Paraburkholderia saeva]|uniref:Uncharacterized protein n=1 Tax=Paraburkholderia saeva TaxID=2777537 RepID=A0A9N8RTY8_9BURK|nr:hypothetical protein LMG31841_01164 [Paraburkholderia saeva]CAG4914428.1 hypothetical protein R70241_04237 [Paraburkholderia saeva]